MPGELYFKLVQAERYMLPHKVDDGERMLWKNKILGKIPSSLCSYGMLEGDCVLKRTFSKHSWRIMIFNLCLLKLTVICCEL
jgi:hypothetical protein